MEKLGGQVLFREKHMTSFLLAMEWRWRVGEEEPRRGAQELEGTNGGFTPQKERSVQKK